MSFLDASTSSFAILTCGFVARAVLIASSRLIFLTSCMANEDVKFKNKNKIKNIKFLFIN